MKIHSTTPPAQPSSLVQDSVNSDLFTLEECHMLATDPDFKVNIGHAKKLGVHTFDQAKALMAAALLPNDSIIALFTIARVHLLWILGPTSSLHQRVTRELSDDRLSLLNTSTDALSPALFREQTSALVAATNAILEPEERDAFNAEVSRIIGSAISERDAAQKLFPIVFSALVPKWEQRATQEIQTQSDYFSQVASQNEINYFAQVPLAQFMQGNTARWVDKAIESPKDHGLKHGSFSESRAVANLQAALLCDIVSYDKKIVLDLVPETLRLDTQHLLRLQKNFDDLVRAQCVADLYASVHKKVCDKDELFKTVLDAIRNGDETFGLNLPGPELERLNAILAQTPNAISKLHRQRLRELLNESINAKDMDSVKVSKWHYGSVVDELRLIRMHLQRILRVHFPVYLNVYYQLMEGRIQNMVWRSILSLNNNVEYKNWLDSNEQKKASRIQEEFRSFYDLVLPLVRKNNELALLPTLQACVFGTQPLNPLNELLTVKGGGDFNALNKTLHALMLAVAELRLAIQKRRLSQFQSDFNRRPPPQLNTGFRLL